MLAAADVAESARLNGFERDLSSPMALTAKSFWYLVLLVRFRSSRYPSRDPSMASPQNRLHKFCAACVLLLAKVPGGSFAMQVGQYASELNCRGRHCMMWWAALIRYLCSNQRILPDGALLTACLVLAAVRRTLPRYCRWPFDGQSRELWSCVQ